MNIEKLGENQYRISHGGKTVEFDHEKYEDVFYSASANTTAYYRVLVDAVCETAEEREAMTAMINEGGDMEKNLTALQDAVKALGI
ncbi:MAG: hypothetical protein ACYTCU_11205 [Planctomycetota bacterium]|jgi:hypothetical protein